MIIAHFGRFDYAVFDVQEAILVGFREFKNNSVLRDFCVIVDKCDFTP